MQVDRLPVEVGDTVEIEDVLLVRNGETVSVGTPRVDGAKVQTTVVGQIKGPKIVVFKYKPKNRYRVRSGHRQHYTRLKVEAIEHQQGSTK